MANAFRDLMNSECQAPAGVCLEPEDVVKIEIEHLTAEMALEIHVQLRPADITADLVGSNIHCAADGVRITIPASLAERLREIVSLLLHASHDPRQAGEAAGVSTKRSPD